MMHILMGSIATGKTGYSKDLARMDWIVIADDATTEALHGGFPDTYSPGCKPLYKTTMVMAAMQAMTLGRHVVIDRTNLKRSSRLMWLGLALAMDVEVCLIKFPIIDANLAAMRRFHADPRGRTLEEWKSVAHEQAGDYQEPAQWEYSLYTRVLSPEVGMKWASEDYRQ